MDVLETHLECLKVGGKMNIFINVQHYYFENGFIRDCQHIPHNPLPPPPPPLWRTLTRTVRDRVSWPGGGVVVGGWWLVVVVVVVGGGLLISLRRRMKHITE